jgi:hypothetical protein
MPAADTTSAMGQYSSGTPVTQNAATNGYSTGAVGNSNLGTGMVTQNGVPMSLIQALQTAGRSSSGY